MQKTATANANWYIRFASASRGLVKAEAKASGHPKGCIVDRRARAERECELQVSDGSPRCTKAGLQDSKRDHTKFCPFRVAKSILQTGTRL